MYILHVSVDKHKIYYSLLVTYLTPAIMVPPTERWLTVKSTSASIVQQNQTLLNRRWSGRGSRILSSWRRITGPFIRLTCCSKRVRSSIRLLCGLGALKYCIILNFTRDPRSKHIPKIVWTMIKANSALTLTRYGLLRISQSWNLNIGWANGTL